MAAKKRDDATTNEKAFNDVRATIAAVPDEKIVGLNIDLSQAAMAGLVLVDRAREDGRAERIDKLAPEFIEVDLVDKLETVCLGAQFIVDNAATEEATAVTVMVDPAVFERATQVKARMIKCILYNMEGTQSVEDEVADIKLGTGYMDLAQDLTRLAVLYAKHVKTLSKDPKNYRDTDLAQARADANEVRAQYRASKTKAADWDRLRPKAYVEIQRLYNEVRDAIRYAYRHQPDVTDQFEALRTAVGIVSKKKEPKAEEKKPEDKKPEEKKPEGEPKPEGEKKPA